jgi:hypothetical protein
MFQWSSPGSTPQPANDRSRSRETPQRWDRELIGFNSLYPACDQLAGTMTLRDHGAGDAHSTPASLRQVFHPLAMKVLLSHQAAIG